MEIRKTICVLIAATYFISDVEELRDVEGNADSHVSGDLPFQLDKS